MEIKYMSVWDFSKPLFEGCSIKCPECKEYSKHTLWRETEVSCEDCGDHSAIVCPKCEEYYDCVGGPTFEIK